MEVHEGNCAFESEDSYFLMKKSNCDFYFHLYHSYNKYTNRQANVTCNLYRSYACLGIRILEVCNKLDYFQSYKRIQCAVVLLLC